MSTPVLNQNSILTLYSIVVCSFTLLVLVKQAVDETTDAHRAHTLYVRALEVNTGNSTFTYTMATSEVQAIRQEQASPTSDPDPGPSKPGHNNPDEVAHYLKDITCYTDVFMENISSFNRYVAEDAYQNYVFNLHK